MGHVINMCFNVSDQRAISIDFVFTIDDCTDKKWQKRLALVLDSALN